MKVYLPNDSWTNEILSILGDLNQEFEFESKHIPESIKEIPWWKKFSFKREPAVGGPGLEGLVPLLQQGVDVFLQVRDSYPYIALEVWSIYEFARNKSLHTKVFFQTITDSIVGEAGETPLDQKSITFIWPSDLTKEQFENLVEKVSGTRKFIFEILLKLDRDTTKQINYMECKAIDGEWKINIINK